MRVAPARLVTRRAALVAGCLLVTLFILHPVAAQSHSHLATAPVMVADGGGTPSSVCGGGAGGPC